MSFSVILNVSGVIRYVNYADVSVMQVLRNLLGLCLMTEENLCTFFAKSQASFH